MPVLPDRVDRDAPEFAERRAALLEQLGELETQLAIARVSGIIPSSVHAQLSARVASLSQRVSNQLNHIERHVDKNSPTASLPIITETP